MQLDRFLSGRFAPQNSPTRERRELGLQLPAGKPRQRKPDGSLEESEQTDTVETTDATGALDATKTQTKNRVESLVGVDIPPELLHSEPLFRSLLGANIDDSLLTQEQLDSWKKIKDWKDGERVNPEDIENVVKNPEILVRCITQLDANTKDLLRTTAFLTGVEKADPHLISFMQADFDAHEGIDWAIPHAEQSGSFEKYVAAQNKANALLKPPRPPLDVDFKNREDMAQRRRNFLNDVHSALHRKKTIAGWAQRELQGKNSSLSQEQIERNAPELLLKLSTSLKKTLDAYLRRELGTGEKTRSVKEVADIIEHKTSERPSEEAIIAFGNIADALARRSGGDAKAFEEATNNPFWNAFQDIETKIPKDTDFSELCLRVKEDQSDSSKHEEVRHDRPGFLTYAEHRLSDLRAARFERLEKPENEQDAERKETERWATRTAERIWDLRGSGQLPVNERTKGLIKLGDLLSHYRNTTPEQRREFRGLGRIHDVERGAVSPADYSRQDRQMIDTELLFYAYPRLARIRDEEEQRIASMVNSVPETERTPTGIAQIAEETATRLQILFGKNDKTFIKAATHDATIALGIPGELEGKGKHHEISLRSIKKALAEDKKVPTSKVLNDSLRETMTIRREVELMESSFKKLQKLPTQDDPFSNVEFTDDLEEGELAHFEDGKIRISRKYEPKEDDSKEIEEWKKTNAWHRVDHERGHAMLRILTRDADSRLFPMILAATYEKMRDREVPGTEFRFEQAFDSLQKVTIANGNQPYRDIAEQFAGKPEILREEMMEEFYLRYATWKNEKNTTRKAKNFADLEKTLFVLIETDESFSKPLPPAPEFNSLDSPSTDVVDTGGDDDREKFKRKLQGTDDAEDHGLPPPSPEGGGQTVGGFNAREELEAIKATYEKGQRFHRAYKDEAPEHAEIILRAAQDAKSHYDDLYHTFTDHVARGHYPDGRPEQDDGFREKVRKVGAHCDKMDSWMKSADTGARDTTGAPTHAAGFFDNMKLWSISDFIKFSKDTWEDIQSIYKRAQDRNIKDTSEVITGALQNLPAGVPFLEKYYKGLNAYNKRRYSQTEVEAANKWKEGMENEDSHTLLHYLHTTRNKDAVRGIISLLCSRGEMNWDDTGVWKTLNKLGRYEMPIGPCARDSVLRDTWFRKVITDIYNDRELYFHWRSENDGKIKSGKSGFTDIADQLSNVGGMRGELQKQLKLQQDSIDNHTLPSQDVKPHLYEEVLTYAMRNGKMTMEDKFYYLIQGIDKGILGIERLGSMAGEKGEILYKFPFIDFFYQKNNSMDEIHRFAKEIQEDKADQKFTPGFKTTLFLYYKVARSEEARVRISKAISRVAEGLDHEDIPFLITQMDYGTINNLANVISGSRQKVTIEGWKNAYVGFNTYFKTFGELANLDDQGLDRFTAQDANGVAQTITSYIFMDNILTRNGVDKDDATARPALTADQFETGCPSGNGRMTGEYRKRANQFLSALFSDRYLGRYLPRDEQLASRNLKGEAMSISVSDFAPITDPNSFQVRNADPNKKYAVFDATGRFSQRLKEVLSDPEAFKTFKTFLREYNQSTRTPLFNEGSDSRQFTREDVVTIIEAQRHGQIDGHGDAHGGGGHH